jgi:hypothetical protein
MLGWLRICPIQCKSVLSRFKFLTNNNELFLLLRSKANLGQMYLIMKTSNNYDWTSDVFSSHQITTESLDNIRFLVIENDWFSTLWLVTPTDVKRNKCSLCLYSAMYFLVMIMDYPGQGFLKVYGCQQGVHEGKIVIF